VPNRYRYQRDGDQIPSGYSMECDTNRVIHFDPEGGPCMAVGSSVGCIDGDKIIAWIELQSDGTYLYLADTQVEADMLAIERRDAVTTTTHGGQCISIEVDMAKMRAKPLPNVIGMIGQAGSGKDSVADYVVKNYGFTKLAFADPLKQAVQVMFNIDDKHMFDRDLREEVLEGWEPWSTRKLLQFVGTELMRTQVDESIWVKNAVSRIKKLGDVIIADVRFPNEVDDVKARLDGMANTVFIRVSRPDHLDAQGGIQNHASESFIDGLDADIDIVNDGTFEDLYAKVDDIMKTILDK